MTKDNIASTDWKNNYYCIYCQRVEDKEKRRHFAMASLCKGFALSGHEVILQRLLKKLSVNI